MTRVSLSLFVSFLLLALCVLANSDKCSSGEYRSLVPSLTKDRYSREYCASLPPSHRVDRSNCPSGLKGKTYGTMKTACDCVNKACKKPSRSSPQSSCPKASGCGGYCAEFKTDKNNCGKCGNKCSDGKKCVSRKCKSSQPTCPTPKKLCYGNCIDCQTDNNNCGGCGSSAHTDRSATRGNAKHLNPHALMIKNCAMELAKKRAPTLLIPRTAEDVAISVARVYPARTASVPPI
ncbi:hypothetical protein Slin14017_G063080 [Septoria linicola]|nr:hypothetical protein Slin14017_G063080 [Septoria linicola]